MNASRYKFSTMLEDIDSETINNPFDKLLQSIGFTINNIANIEKTCIENELEISAEIKKLMADSETQEEEEETIPIDNLSDDFLDSPLNNNIDCSENRLVSIEQQSIEGIDSKEATTTDSSGIELTIEQEEEIEEKLINKLYKQLALKCHPDKTSDSKKNKMFIYMTECKRELDIIKLLYIFSKLNTDNIGESIEIGKEENHIINKKLDSLESYRDNLVGSVFYKWKSLSEKEKESYIVYLKNYFKL